MRTDKQVVYVVYLDGQVADVTTDGVSAGLRVNGHLKNTSLEVHHTVAWKIQAMLANSKPGSDNMLGNIQGVGVRCTLEDVHDLEEMLETLNAAGALQGARGSRS